MSKSTLVKQYSTHKGRNPFAGTPEQREEYRQLAEALNEEARANWDNPEFHRQVAADLAQTLDYGFEATFDDLPFNAETVGEFDRVAIRERRGMKAFWTARGGYVAESSITSSILEVPRDTIGFKVSEFEDRLRANFAESIGDMSDLGAQRLSNEVYRRFFNLLQAAVPSTSPYYSSGATLDAATLNPIITAVKDAIRPDGQAKVPVTIIGRAASIDPISDLIGFDPVALEMVRENGYLGRYRGCDVVSLQHFADEDGVSYVPGNELWVVAGNAGRFVKFGGLRVRSWDDPDGGYQFTKGTSAAGAIINHPEVTHRFINTAISAS